MGDTIDLAALADKLEEASMAVADAAQAITRPALAPVPSRTVEALEGMWRLQGQLQGMADALRMVEARRD